MEQITTLMETMSFAEKLSLNERIATAIRKEGGKAGSKKAKVEGEAKPKRKSAAGTLAWQAYVKHIKTTQPDAFDGIKKEADKLQIIKGIRAEDGAGYDTFVAEWKANYEASQAKSADEAEEAEETEVEVVVAPAKASPVTAAMTPAQKIAALNAAKAAKAALAAPAAKAEAPAKKEVKKAAKAEKAAKPVKAAKKAKEATEEEVPQMATLILKDLAYWHDEDTHALWRKEGEKFEGDNWIGYYQPGEEEPIRYTENFGDE